MNKKLLIIIAGILLISGFSFYFLKKETPKNVASETVQTQPTSNHEGHAAENSQPHSQTETVEEPPTIEISTDKQQLIGVKTTTVDFKDLQKVIRTVGRVEYDERKIATVNTHIEGWIERLFVNYTGKYVKRGEPLLSIYSHELISSQEEYLIAYKWMKEQLSTPLKDSAASLLDAARQRLKLWNISDGEIEELERLGKPIKSLTIYSHAEGYVSEKMAFEGMMVKAGEPLFKIADLSNVWIMADVYEYEMPFIKTGSPAKISLSYFPGKEFSSRIEYVYPSLSGETRTAKVRFSMPNPDLQLKPQMFTNVEIKVSLGRRLAIPQEAVIDTGIRQVVYVDKGDGYFEPREVVLGISMDDMREVLKGLGKGDKVVTSANFLIDSEAQLKGVKPLGHKH